MGGRGSGGGRPRGSRLLERFVEQRQQCHDRGGSHRRHLLEPSASGGVNAQTVPLVNGIKLALSQAGGKAGRSPSTTSRLTTRPRRRPQVRRQPVGGERPQGRDRFEGRLLHRRVQLWLQQGHDPDPQPGGGPAGQPSEHLRRTDDQRPGKCARRATEVLPDRQANLPAAGSARLDPGRRRPDRDEGGRLHESGGHQRQDGVRRRARHPGAAPAGQYGLKVTSNTALDPTSPNFRSFASTVKGQGADCVYRRDRPTGAVELIKDITSAVPGAKIYGGDGVCSRRSPTRPRAAFPRASGRSSTAPSRRWT